MLSSLLWLLAATPQAHAACPASFRDVSAGAETALTAYEGADLAGFDAARAGLGRDLACLVGVLEPAEAMQLHLVAALGAWREQDVAATQAAIRAAQSLDPDFVLQAQVGVLDRRLVALVEQTAVTLAPGEPMVLPLVPWSTWRVDGRLAVGATPVGQAALLQLSDTRTDTTRTWYLPLGGLPEGFADPDAQGLVAWQRDGPQAPAGPGVPEAQDPDVKALLSASTVAPQQTLFRPDTRARRLALAGGGLATAGTVSLLIAASLKDEFMSCKQDFVCDESTKIGVVAANQVSGYGGYALLLTGAGLGVGAVVNRRF